MCEFRLCRLADGGAQGDDFLVVGHQFPKALDVLVLLNLLQVVVENKRLALNIERLALNIQLRLVVLSGVEGTDVPRESGANHAVQRPLAAHHVLEHVVARITIKALRKDSQFGFQGGIDGFLLGICQSQLGIDGL